MKSITTSEIGNCGGTYFLCHIFGDMAEEDVPARSGLLLTSLSIRSFFSCSKEMTSTSARARGSRQMRSAGT